MQSLQSKTVREIALEMPITTRVFEEFKIDYCCHGNVLFDEACRGAGASPGDVSHRIDDLLEDAGGNIAEEPLSKASLCELVDYILDKHHTYTKRELEQLPALMAKVATRHGEHNPYLLELKAVFESVCDDLWPHMQKEEMVLFPYIEDLERKFSRQMMGSMPPFGTVINPVRMMRMEHEEVGELLAKMRELTNEYALPDGACPSFTALYHRLAEFERDIHQHIHLENNLLFPRAVELEQQVFPLAMH
jgi:regulator of cell morphogenesis and NO signaling